VVQTVATAAGKGGPFMLFVCYVPNGKGWRRVPNETATNYLRAARRVRDAYCVSRVRVSGATREAAESMDFRVVQVRFASVEA
jgi:hypothetical protein